MTRPETPAAAPAHGPPRAALPPWVPLLVFAAAWLAHGSALGVDWIGDDAALVRDSAVVARGPSGVGGAFGPEAWTGEAERGVWRPLTIYSFCLESPIWSGDGIDAPAPFGFHLTNLCLHGLAAVLLLLLGRRLAPRRPLLVAGTALVYAVHPLHAQAVATLAGRADLLAFVFALLAARLWVDARRGRPALLPLSALALFLALLSKETAVGLPLVLILLDVVAPGAPDAARRPASRLAAYGVLLVPVALWALRWPWFTPDLRAGLDGLGAATIALFVPVGLASDLFAETRGFTDLTISPVALGTGGAVLAGGAVALLGWPRRGGPVALALATTTLLWPAAVLVSPPGLPLMPRFAMLPGIGLTLLGGALLSLLWARPRRRLVGAAVGALVLLALGSLTWSEARAWADADAFEEALVQRHPESDPLLLRRARRMRSEAVAERRRAALRPLAAEERDALVERTTGRLEEARSYVLAVVRRADPLEPESEGTADAYRELGFILQELARTPESVGVLRDALRLEPWLRDEARRAALPPARRALLVETFLRLARAEEAVGDLREAAIHVEHAAELAPTDTQVLHTAGRTLTRAGEYERARRRLLAALGFVLDPATRRLVERDLEAARDAARRTADASLQAARQAIADGRQRDALARFEEALAADPTLLRAYEEYAFLLGQWFGRYAQAYEAIDAAERTLGELGYPAEDTWWRRLGELRAKIEAWEAEDD